MAGLIHREETYSGSAETMIKALLITFAAGVFIALPRAAFAQPTETIEVRIAGGQKIVANISRGGPVPAEDLRIKIEYAGMLVGPSRANSREPELIWNFSFRSKTNHNVLAVIVDDVTSDPVKTIVGDLEPVLRKDSWSGFAEPIVVTKEALPWVFDSGPTMKVFRFTVRYDDDQRSILHQLAMFSAAAKEQIRERAALVRSGR
ncbi:MAG TPA: hypothetical protein VKH64_08565 [Candidatus Binatia bacterium]|nr:hypothetical protein [Candidatus Binatia bacterium]